MATRCRKIARSAIRRVKRNNASKNVRHKLKTHRRRHRKIVMRGGAVNYNAHYYFKDDESKGLKCVLVQEHMGYGTKDTVLMFWPVYVTDKQLRTMLGLYIKPDKINYVLAELLKDKPNFEPSIKSMALPKYLKLSSMKTGIASSKYNPNIAVKSLVDETSVEITDALKETFDREKLKKDLSTTTDEEKGLVGENENAEFKNAVKFFIDTYSKNYVKELCNADYTNTQPIGWCGKHVNSSSENKPVI